MRFLASSLLLAVAQLSLLEGFIPTNTRNSHVLNTGFKKKAFLPSSTARYSQKTPRPPSSGRFRPKTPPLEDLAEGPTGLYFLNDDKNEKTKEDAKVTYELRWEDFSENSLRDELEMRGLSNEGTKEDLVTRLEADDAKSPSQVQGRVVARQFKEWTMNFLTAEIQKGVPPKAIKGAALAAAAATALAGKGIATAGISSVIAAYTAILPGGTSDAVRLLGTVAYDTADTAISLMKRIDANKTVETLSKISRDAIALEKSVENMISTSGLEESSEEELVAFAKAVEIEADKIVKEAQERRMPPQSAERLEVPKPSPEAVRRSELTARKLMENRFHYEAIARAARSAEEKAQLAEVARLAEEAKREEEARLAEEARIAEEEALFAEAEEARLAAEVERIRKEQEAKAAELLAEQEKVKQRLMEEIGPAEKAVMEKAAERQTSLDEEEQVSLTKSPVEAELETAAEEEDSISAADWEASIRAAQESIDRTIAGIDDALTEEDEDDVDWEEAEKLAESLRGALPDEEDDEEEMDIEALAQAAREAVDTFEKVQQVEEKEKVAQRDEWSSRMDVPVEDIAEESHADGQDWSEMTVAELRSELALRGLPTGGRKTDLIARLEKAVSEEEVWEDDFETTNDLEAIAKAAREAVEMFGDVETGEDVSVMLDDSGVPDEAEVDLDALGKAAREAVEMFDDSEEVLDYGEAGEDVAMFDDDETDFDALAKAAREAVEMFGGVREDVDSLFDDSKGPEAVKEPLDLFDGKGAIDELDDTLDETEESVSKWSQMTVTKLRDELKSRGLPTTGKKNELIARLEASGSGGEVDVVGQYVEGGLESVDLFDAAEAAVVTDWSKFTVAQLRGELSSRGLPTTGKKAELVATLESLSAKDEDEDEIDLEELARAAREAVQRFDLDEEPSDEALWEIEVDDDDDTDETVNDGLWDIEEAVEKPDFSAMTVAQLKQELKKKGLPVSGKKADLIARLEQ